MKFTTIKDLFFKKNVDIEKVLVFDKICSGERNYKYFIGALYNDHKVKPLHLKLPKTSAYVNSYDGQTKWMYFSIEDNDLLEKYNIVCDKVSTDIKKELDSKPVYNKTFFKSQIKSYDNEATGFYDIEVPKVDANYTCLAVISLGSPLKKDKNYYSQVFLKECKDIEKKVIRHNNDNLSDFSYSDESDDSNKE